MKYETSSLTIEEFFGLKPKEVEPKKSKGVNGIVVAK